MAASDEDLIGLGIDKVSRDRVRHSTGILERKIIEMQCHPVMWTSNTAEDRSASLSSSSYQARTSKVQSQAQVRNSTGNESFKRYSTSGMIEGARICEMKCQAERCTTN